MARRGVVAAGVGAAAILVVLVWLRGGDGSRAGPLLTAPVERGEVRRTVSATGTLQALVTVQVGSQVTGVIELLGADFNSVVRAGEVIARIDPSTFEAQLARAEADLVASEAQVRGAAAAVANQRANVLAAQANLEGARASEREAAASLARSRELASARVVSERDLEVAEAGAEEAAARVRALEAQLEQSRAQLRSAQAQLEQARAQVEQARAAVRVARVNLDHTVITSPIDGVVISRNVDVGQTVAASLQAPTLFVIANDLTQMDVIVSVDEADIGAITDTTPVTFTVDAFPGEVFRGRIRQVRIQPRTEQNVVTYDVLVGVRNEELKLRPGMTASVTMTVAEAEDVLKVPNAALRFWPEEVPRERMREILAAEGGPPVAVGPRGDGREAAGASDLAGLSAEAQALAARLRDPSLAREERRALFEQLRALPSEEREKLRAVLGLGGWREGGDAPVSARAATEGGTIRFPAPASAPPRPAVVWVVGETDALEPRRALVTITDGRVSAVVGGDLREGERVAIGRATAPSAERTPVNPFAPNPYRERRR